MASQKRISEFFTKPQPPKKSTTEAQRTQTEDEESSTLTSRPGTSSSIAAEIPPKANEVGPANVAQAAAAHAGGEEPSSSLTAAEDPFQLEEMVRKVETCASEMGLKMPDTAPRVSRTPARYRQTTVPEAVAHDTATVIWRRDFYEAVDLVSVELKRRFDQEAMKIAANRERAVIQAAEGRTVDLEPLHLPKELDTGHLDLQLKMLGNVTRGSDCSTVQDVASCLSKLHPQTRGLFVEAEKLAELCLCLPISVASSERTFSTLRRLKTWLRSTMTQKRLTHLALMHVHTDILNSLDIHALMRAFITTTPERKATFGLI